MTANQLPARSAARDPVVVGIDGSGGSVAALDIELERVGGVYFVSDFRYVACAFAGIAPIVLDPSGEWLREAVGSTCPVRGAWRSESPPSRSPAACRGAIGRLRVGIGPNCGRSQVRVFLGPARERHAEIVVPLAWEPLQPGPGLPGMEGDLMLTQMDAGGCRLGLTGRYRLPLAAPGCHADRLVVQPVAESSVRNFLEDIAIALLRTSRLAAWLQPPSCTAPESSDDETAPATHVGWTTEHDVDATASPAAPVESRQILAGESTELVMRPISPEDDEALVAFHATLSDESVYYRFFGCHPRLSPAEVHRFTHGDGTDRVALVVVDKEAIVAVGRYDRRDASSEAEVAFVVTDSYQHHGLATLLLKKLADIARGNGIGTFVAETLADNHRMRRVFADAGYDVRATFDGGTVHVTFPIG